MDTGSRTEDGGLLTLGEWYEKGGVKEIKKRLFSRQDNFQHYQVLEERDCGVEGLLFGINYLDNDGKQIADAIDWIDKRGHSNDHEYMPPVSPETEQKPPRN